MGEFENDRNRSTRQGGNKPNSGSQNNGSPKNGQHKNNSGKNGNNKGSGNKQGQKQNGSHRPDGKKPETAEKVKEKLEIEIADAEEEIFNKPDPKAVTPIEEDIAEAVEVEEENISEKKIKYVEPEEYLPDFPEDKPEIKEARPVKPVSAPRPVPQRTQTAAKSTSKRSPKKAAPPESAPKQAVNIIKYILEGKIRKAAHYSISSGGNKSWMLLLPLQILLPLAFTLSGSMIFTDAVLNGSMLFRVSLLWVEQLIILLIVMRLISRLSGCKMSSRASASLVSAAMTPLTLCAIVSLIAAFILPELALAILALGAMLFAIMLYMGVETSGISAKVRTLGWFSAGMFVWLFALCLTAKQLINFI